MLKFFARRLFLLILTMFLTSVFIFFILRLNGTDAAMSYLNASGISPTTQALEHARTQLGLDKPILTQYILWLKNALFLDFGNSYITARPVASDMAYYFPATFKLAILALIFTVLVSVVLGVCGAIYKDKFIDQVVKFLSFIGVCMPNFWLGFLLIMFFSVKLKLLPPFGGEGFANLIMPVITISLMSIAINSRLIRTNILELKNSRHIIYAKARGVGRVVILFRHILKNVSLPIITALGMHLGELVGSALVVESVFAYPGVGLYAVNAIINNDYPVIECFILLMAFCFIALNILTDALYALIDPRIKKAMV
ncbi:MAG: ABC transporter permease subunit [Campylobacter sp.]|nr:ABC transporter permease subunit [Campylobacter sp.]